MQRFDGRNHVVWQCHESTTERASCLPCVVLHCLQEMSLRKASQASAKNGFRYHSRLKTNVIYIWDMEALVKM